MYNNVINRGERPIKALYPVSILIGCAIFFTGGFAFGGWNWSWIGLALAAVAVVVVLLIDKSQK